MEEKYNSGELKMSVSAICRSENGNQYAFVTFTDGVRSAEGRIPECKLLKNNGFAEIEVKELEKYMQEHLQELKRMSAGVDIFSAFKGD